MEALTTGEMLTKIKQRERAYVPEGFLAGVEVEKSDYNEIIVKHGPNEGGPLQLRYHEMHAKWLIKPYYVSFDEAMEAHSEKKTVIYHHDDESQYRFEYSLEPGQFEKLYFDSITLHELVEGKWTIEG